MTMQVGFAGLGIMGRAMSRNILKAGYALSVWNRSPGPAGELAREGARACATPAEAAAGADALVLMLTNPEAVEAVLFGPDGAAAALKPGAAVLNMGTNPPAFGRDLAARLAALGLDCLDAPVSGSKKPAEEGTLVILAGGEDRVLDRFEPLLLTMGKKVVRCGPAGAGSTMKMAVNLLLGVMMEGLAEAVDFGRRGGLSPELVLSTVLAGPLSNGLFQLKAPMLAAGDYPPQFPLKHMDKDLGYMAQAADASGAAAPLGRAARSLYAKALREGFGDMDFAAVARLLEQA